MFARVRWHVREIREIYDGRAWANGAFSLKDILSSREKRSDIAY